MPENALPGLNTSTKKLLKSMAFCGEFLPVPNRKNVWKKVIELNGKNFEVVAVETKT